MLVAQRHKWLLSNKSNKVLDCSVMSDEGSKVTLLVFEATWQLRWEDEWWLNNDRNYKGHTTVKSWLATDYRSHKYDNNFTLHSTESYIGVCSRLIRWLSNESNKVDTTSTTMIKRLCLWLRNCVNVWLRIDRTMAVANWTTELSWFVQRYLRRIERREPLILFSDSDAAERRTPSP